MVPMQKMTARQIVLPVLYLQDGNSMALAVCCYGNRGVLCCARQGSRVYSCKNDSRAEKYDSTTANKMKDACECAYNAKKLRKESPTLFDAYKNPAFKKLNEHVFAIFPGWAAYDTIAATVYAFLVSPDDVMEAIYLGFHTSGDSDSIASMTDALLAHLWGNNNYHLILLRI